jgi:hypothetical protein
MSKNKLKLLVTQYPNRGGYFPLTIGIELRGRTVRMRLKKIWLQLNVPLNRHNSFHFY